LGIKISYEAISPADNHPLINSVVCNFAARGGGLRAKLFALAAIVMNRPKDSHRDGRVE
jgi:hypothetical protein